MIKSLTYSVTFPTTGRTFNETIEFEDGFGAITGPNEAGKSLIIEMIRWCLFGTAALRGTASDYKNLKAELVFVIKGEEYKVTRSPTNAKLWRDDEEIATGVRPVNAKIVQLMGFGLDVFDIACVANQDELTKLGSLRPTERKRMVDSVIGIGVLEDLAKKAGDEALALNRQADLLADSAIRPMEPVMPEGYEPSEVIGKRRDELMKDKAEYDQLKGWLSALRQEPVKPTETVPLDAASIHELLNQQNEIKEQRQALVAKLAALPQPSVFNDAELDYAEAQAMEYERYLIKQRFLSQYEQPKYTDEQLDRIEEHLKHFEHHRACQRLQERLESYLQHGHHECPNCSHRWPVEAERVATTEAELADLKKLPSREDAPELDFPKLQMHRRVNAIWAEVADKWEEIKDFPDQAMKPKLNLQEIERFREANKATEARAAVKAEIEALDRVLQKQPDYSRMLVERQVYEQQLARYHEDVQSYIAWQDEYRQKRARAMEIEDVEQKLSSVNALYALCRSYENQMSFYTLHKRKYDEVMENVAKFREQAEEWKKVKLALSNLRGLVKQHLVPSLNRVASHLITSMTGGQRQKIAVDEDFNIMVDDQSIDTLSGSGKAVANLALRLGLGQVLTNNVFSLFMGDEIDASMDKDRQQNTTNTLQTLRRKISQILLVTHKYPSADYYIRLGENSEYTHQ